MNDSTADDGLDEFSIASNTLIGSLDNGEITFFDLNPEDDGFSKRGIDCIRADNAEHSAEVIISVLDGREGPAADIVILNAGAAIFLCGQCQSIHEGVEIARKTVAQGAAKNRLQELVEYSRRCA